MIFGSEYKIEAPVLTDQQYMNSIYYKVYAGDVDEKGTGRAHGELHTRTLTPPNVRHTQSHDN